MRDRLAHTALRVAIISQLTHHWGPFLGHFLAGVAGLYSARDDLGKT